MLGWGLDAPPSLSMYGPTNPYQKKGRRRINPPTHPQIQFKKPQNLADRMLQFVQSVGAELLGKLSGPDFDAFVAGLVRALRGRGRG